MLWLKACTRCQGDLVEGEDRFGRFIACLQCGHYLTDRQELDLRGLGRVQPAPAGRAA